MASDDLQNLLRSGIEAARKGDKAEARQLFEQVLEQDDRSELAWMWMASVLDSAEERQHALQQVLQINPNNERAQQALARLKGDPNARTTQSLQSVQPPTREYTPLPPRPRATQQRRGRLSTPVYYAVLIIALGLLGVAALLALEDQVADEVNTPTPEPIVIVVDPNQTPTDTPTATATEPITPIFQLNAPSDAATVELQPTWTDIPPTALPPAATATQPPPALDNYQLVFAGSDTLGGLFEIIETGGNGLGVQRIIIELDPTQITLLRQPAPTRTPRPVSPEDALAGTPQVELPSNNVAPPPQPETPEELYEDLELLDPAISPDGEWIAFTVQLDANIQELFVMNLAQGNARQLTTRGASITDGAAWSPDGTRIAFSSSDGRVTNRADIYVIDVDSGDTTRLTNGLSLNREPAWSPDGTQIVYASDVNTPGELEIYQFTFGGGRPVQLTDDVNGSFSPAISPDGSQIAFISNRSGDNDLYVMDSDGANEQILTIADDDADDQTPAWSPDGAWLAVSSTRNETETLQIWALTPDALNWQQITDNNGVNRAAMFFPSTE